MQVTEVETVLRAAQAKLPEVEAMVKVGGQANKSNQVTK